jgi:hypothetical protein
MTDSPDRQPLYMEEDLLREALIEEQIIPTLHRLSVEQVEQVHHFIDELQQKDAQDG